jgi:hypothetical protein
LYSLTLGQPAVQLVLARTDFWPNSFQEKRRCRRAAN